MVLCLTFKADTLPLRLSASPQEFCLRIDDAFCSTCVAAASLNVSAVGTSATARDLFSTGLSAALVVGVGFDLHATIHKSRANVVATTPLLEQNIQTCSEQRQLARQSPAVPLLVSVFTFLVIFMTLPCPSPTKRSLGKYR